MSGYNIRESSSNLGIHVPSNLFAKSSVSNHKPRKSLIPLRTSNNNHRLGICVKSSFEKEDVFSSSPENRSIRRVLSSRLKNSVSPCQAANLQNVLPFLVHRSNYSPISNEHFRRKNIDDSCCSHKKRNLRSVHSSSLHLPANDTLHENCSEGDIVSVNLQRHFSEAVARVGINVDESHGTLEKKDDNLSFKGHNRSTISTESIPCMKNNQTACSLKKFSMRMAVTAGRTSGYFMCPICSEPFNKPAIIACGHLFCMSCVCGWFETQDNCPCCRYRIISKDIGTSLILAKEYFDASRLLASIFTTANFYTLMDYEPLSYDLENTSGEEQSLLSCKTSKQILENHLAPIFRQFCQQNRNNDTYCNQQKTKTDSNAQKITNCARGAIWFVRRCLLLRRPCEGQQASLEDSDLIQKLPTLIKLEAFRGSESSREALLVKVMMNMKQATLSLGSDDELNPCFRIPRPSLTPSKSKVPTQRFRFRLPSTLGLIRLSISLSLFLMITLVLYLVEGMNKLAFSKVDFIVYAFILVSMIIHTEERMSYRRNRRNNTRGRHNGNRRLRRQRRNLLD
ncbi:unnamed protein product [Orchesella dallaii]|uniref:RING-type domain-containing protein n=1 Tax=Orchesella dallaii TaxID=48710 RepID=A0ABP1QN88_9HEXA